MTIEFYDANKPNGEYSNFYSAKEDKKFQLIIDDKSWQTTEHYYQSQKFGGSEAADEYANLIAIADTPNKSFVLARQKKQGGFKANWKLIASQPTTLNDLITKYLGKGVTIRKDWEKIKDSVMEKALRAKFSQNPHLLKKLLSTGDQILVEHTHRDSYWGDGGNGTGLNKLGKMLMSIRNEYMGKSEVPSKKIAISMKLLPTVIPVAITPIEEKKISISLKTAPTMPLPIPINQDKGEPIELKKIQIGLKPKINQLNENKLEKQDNIDENYLVGMSADLISKLLIINKDCPRNMIRNILHPKQNCILIYSSSGQRVINELNK